MNGRTRKREMRTFFPERKNLSSVQCPVSSVQFPISNIWCLRLLLRPHLCPHLSWCKLGRGDSCSVHSIVQCPAAAVLSADTATFVSLQVQAAGTQLGALPSGAAASRPSSNNSKCLILPVVVGFSGCASQLLVAPAIHPCRHRAGQAPVSRLPVQPPHPVGQVWAWSDTWGQGSPRHYQGMIDGGQWGASEVWCRSRWAGGWSRSRSCSSPSPSPQSTPPCPPRGPWTQSCRWGIKPQSFLYWWRKLYTKHKKNQCGQTWPPVIGFIILFYFIRIAWTIKPVALHHIITFNKIHKNPAYGRQSISRPMRIVAPMP